MNLRAAFPDLQRISFFDGQRLTATDLLALQAYHREMHWLHNRSLHQWGIAVGLGVSGQKGDSKVNISPGFAVDCQGREILVAAPQVVPVHTGERGEASYYLTVAYAEDAELSPSEMRAGVCSSQGAVRLPEQGRVAWRLAGMERQGYDIILAQIWVRNCQLSRPVSLAVRPSAHMTTLPRVMAGQTGVRNIVWSFWPDPPNIETAQGVSTHVDTSSANFASTPFYFANIMGTRVYRRDATGNPTLITGFIEIDNSTPTSFDLRILLAPRNQAAGSAHLNPDDFFLDHETPLAWLRAQWNVVWMGMQG